MPDSQGQERDDAAMLAAVPDSLCFGLMMKAQPSEEAGRRIVYIQASDESVDAQGERVLCKALQDSAEVFSRYGVVDLDHVTMLRERSGVADWQSYEIGRPVDVRFEASRTFVKAELYSGDTPLAKNANMVWDSMTKLRPSARWYASVGGTTQGKSVEIDPVTKARVPVIKSVRWVNLALSRTPVNQSVPVAQHTPFGVFAKSLGGFVVKAEGEGGGLTAGHGTDVNELEGGGALRTQSLDRQLHNYWDFSQRIAGDIHKGVCAHDAASMTTHATRHYGIRADKAEAWVTAFLSHLAEAIQQGKH